MERPSGEIERLIYFLVLDDTPFGGGSGMVMRADVIDSCLDKNIKNSKNELIYLSPRGELLTQKIAKQLSQKNGVDLICGHFEEINKELKESQEGLNEIDDDISAVTIYV